LDENGELYHYHLDHLGTPDTLTDSQGEIAWSVSYTAYGNLAIKHCNRIEQPIRFQGQYYDEETGLHYNRFRYYDPEVGAFTQQDPIGLLGGVNNYQYVPNPVGWVDPLGLTCKEQTAHVPNNARPTFSTTDAVPVSGSRAIDLGQSYEVGVRGLYGDAPFSQRQYEALVDGKWVSGVADNVVTIDDKSTAIEAKFVDDWAKSLRNPGSQNGSKPWALAEQQKMLHQARKYSAAFDNVVYHTNSVDLATYYSKVFTDSGINNFKFVITPAKKY
ncbi:RHS domain-containing protein, partial [Microbulbifer thermotolerans]